MEIYITKYFDKRWDVEWFILDFLKENYIYSIKVVKTRETHPTNPNQWEVKIQRCTDNFITKHIVTEYQNWGNT